MYTLPSHARLLTKKDYSAVFDGAKKIDHREVFALFKKNSAKRARLGVIISKKSCQKACDRNRIKRLIRESFRLKEHQNFDIIILSRKGVSKLSNKQIFHKLSCIWEKLDTF